MIAGTPTGTVAGDRTLPPVARELCWLPGSRLSNGEAMPDRAALIQAQIPGLRRFACALLRGDREVADDLVQDTLERALSRWNLRRNQGNLRGWLYTILYNRFLSNQHRLRRRGPHDALMEDTELRGIEGGQHSVLEHRDLVRAFAALPEEQRVVLLLVGVEDLSYQEAARGHCQLNGPRAPFCCPARLERGTTIGEQRTFRPEPPRHRHNENTTGG
jgi:RNA polymerase sigma factor (sigma-70 family)